MNWLDMRCEIRVLLRAMMLRAVGVFSNLNEQITHDDGYRESVLRPLLLLSTLLLCWWKISI